MPTLKEVAARAGVSIATVSCCLSGAKNVKPETKAVIMDAIEELKYIPNHSARSLKNSGSQEIGVVLTDIDDIFHADIFKGVSAYFQNRSYSINVAFTNHSPDVECAKVDEFISKNVAGLVLLTCQPGNRAFFESRMEFYNIPTVFLQRRPEIPECNLIRFDDEKAIFQITHALLKSGYDRIALLTGHTHYSCEQDALLGYRRAHRELGFQEEAALHHATNLSKESAFKAAIELLNVSVPQALVATSVPIAKGALQAASVLGIQVPGQMKIVTLSEENWNESGNLPGVVHTARPAFAMGRSAANLLLENIRSPVLFEKQTVVMQDNFDTRELRFPAFCPSPAPALLKPMPTLRVLMAELNTTRSIQAISRHFTNQYGIALEFETARQNEMLGCILEDFNRARYRYDIYMYDIPWLDYLAQSTLISDITEFVEGPSFDRSCLFPENLAHCYDRGRCYGIPIVGGSQLMFYRRDLFENSQVRREFQRAYQVSLRPPKTWTEFNGIARFFTRRHFPDSPTECGTSFAGIIDEELAPEILIRLWSHGGNLFDPRNNTVQLRSPQSEKAYRSILGTLQSVGRDPFSTSINDTIADFCGGKTAMLLTYSEYANVISNAMVSSAMGRVGFEALPGKTPMSVGWNLGVNRLSDKKELAFAYFSWLCQRDISYYMTILDGQSTVTAPYHSSELLRLYPWMALTEASFPFTRDRTGPSAKNRMIIPRGSMEKILCDVLRNVLLREEPLEGALEAAHQELVAIFSSYGYGLPPKPSVPY